MCVFQKVSRACVRWTEKESVPVLSAGWASVGRSGKSSHVSSVFGFSETKLQSRRRGGERASWPRKEAWHGGVCLSVFPVPGRQKQEEQELKSP